MRIPEPSGETGACTYVSDDKCSAHQVADEPIHKIEAVNTFFRSVLDDRDDFQNDEK
jgi:hypothetical protein